MPGARPVGRFPKHQRLTTRSDFDAVKSQNRRVVSPHFVFLMHARRHALPPPDSARLGVVASRKIGNAVQRNRAKRLVREAFRATRDLWPSGMDVVVIVRASLGSLKLSDVVDEWRGETRRLQSRGKDARTDAARRSAGGG